MTLAPLSRSKKTYPEEFTQARVVGLAWFPFYVLQVLGKPEAQHLEHAIQRLVGGADGDEGVRGIEVVPVLEVRGGLQQLRGEREAHVGEIRDADEPSGDAG